MCQNMFIYLYLYDYYLDTLYLRHVLKYSIWMDPTYLQTLSDHRINITTCIYPTSNMVTAMKGVK